MQQSKDKVLRSIGIVFILLSLIHLSFVVFLHASTLFKKYNPQDAEKKYSQSQWQQSQNISSDKVLDEWAISNGHTGWKNYMDETVDTTVIANTKSKILKGVADKGVSDSFLYTYVGYRYIQGVNPSLLNPEHPPLAKLMIGSSITLFGSEHVIGVFVAFLTLLLVGLISYLMKKSILLSGISMLLTSLLPLFTDQLINGPQLELYQLFFFLGVVLFITWGTKKNNTLPFILAGIAYGMLLSTKTLLPFLALFSVWLLLSLRARWKELTILFAFGAVTFCLTYYSFFLQGGTLRTFLGLQKYIVTYYGNANIPYLEFAGNYLRLIFTGSWKFWDSARSVSAYSQWNLLWPLLFLVGMYGLKRQWITYKHTHLLIWFILLYNVFVFIVPVFPRYLLLLYIPLIILL